ncbi:MAG: hypothetical protein K2L27_02735 [Muribaculaceae bacterium]|nr:hypothetical protein [Muribaculaceae bacterium]
MNAMRAAVVAMLCVAAAAAGAQAQRRITPVNTAATATQSRNETKNDTAAINSRRRAASVSFVDDKGQLVWVDTVTGDKWIDSLAQTSHGIPKMQYPLLHSVSVGIDVWDAAMRLFGQDYGLAGVCAEVNLHNRYIPVLEAGLGNASHTPSGGGYRYRTPVAPYFRIGANYNFLYNSNPDYMLTAGLRYGFSAFGWSVSDVDVNSPYWQETATFNIPRQHNTAGWLEICFGLRVKVAGPVSAGWMFKYHSLLHCGSTPYGSPWYIPGYGARKGSITGAFYITYTLPLRRHKKEEPEADASGL